MRMRNIHVIFVNIYWYYVFLTPYIVNWNFFP